MRILLLCLLLCLPALALTDEETKVLKKAAAYYRAVEMEGRARWLETEVAANRVCFGEFTGKESNTAAAVNMRTGVITINEKILRENTFGTWVDLGNTLAHEKVHQGQSYLGWCAQTYQQDLGMGNEYEVAGWAESMRVARQTAISLQKRLIQATSARDREVAGRRLKVATEAWQSLAFDWREKSKEYGNFGPRDFIDEDGLTMNLDAMAKQCNSLAKQALAAYKTSESMNFSYKGRYRGSVGGGARGTFNFDVRADQSIVGTIEGNHTLGAFKGGLEGRVDSDGLIRGGRVDGVVTRGGLSVKFSGDFSGSLSRSGGSGRWRAGAEGPNGTWSVNLK